MVLKAGQCSLSGILRLVSMYGFGSYSGLKDIQKLIGKSIPVIKEHPFVTADGLKAQKIKTEEIKAKTKENKIYRGSRTNGDFWRRKKQTSQNNTPKGVGR